MRNRKKISPELRIWKSLLAEIDSLSFLGNHTDTLVEIRARAVMLARRCYGDGHEFVSRLEQVFPERSEETRLFYFVGDQARTDLRTLLAVIVPDWSLLEHRTNATNHVGAQPITGILHPSIIAEALPEIYRGVGHFDDAIFKAYKAVEVAVRKAAKYDNDKFGVTLMNAAFGDGGPLRDASAERGEAESIRQLFVGAVGAFKNPVSHRLVDERDPNHAMRLLVFASVLLELLERAQGMKTQET